MYKILYEILHRQPFQPLEVRLSDGNSYVIKHPELVYLTKLTLVIALPDSNEIAICFLLHIAEIRVATK